VESWGDCEIVGVREFVKGEVKVARVAGEGEFGGKKGNTFGNAGIAVAAVVDRGIQSVLNIKKA